MIGGLGRRIHTDYRNLKVSEMSEADEDRARAERVPFRDEEDFKAWGSNAVWLAQGNTGTCVGHGTAHALEDKPIHTPGDVDPYLIYRLACTLDPWPENDDGNVDAGTSVLAGMKAAQQLGYIESYYAVTNMEEWDHVLMEVGDIVIGINWYRSFDEVGPDGYAELDPSSGIRGGHCLKADARNRGSAWNRLKNSWGRDFAYNGWLFLQDSAIERLLAEGGDAFVMVPTPR